MRRPWAIILVSAFALGCGSGRSSLTTDEQALFAQLSFDVQLMSEVKTFGESFERLIGLTPNLESVPANGVVLTTAPSRGRAVLLGIRAVLRETPYAAYLNDDAFGTAPDKIAIVRSHNQYEYLAIVRTEGINYDIDHESVLARYRAWDDKFGVSLLGAGQDWLEAEFRSAPKDWRAFGAEVYEFCPDVVDQGAGDVESLIKAMQSANTVYLWWD